MKLKSLAIVYFNFFVFGHVHGQKFTSLDSLRGAYHPNRSSYDLLHYHLKIKVEPATRYISGSNKLTCKGLSESRMLQIDLAETFDIDVIKSSKGDSRWKRYGNSVVVTLPGSFKSEEIFWIQVFYKGHPHVAANAPWEGGFVWEKDKDGIPWIGVACEGDGASLWFPSKDHPLDEPDSVFLQYEIPRNLIAVGNGQFVKKESVTDSTNLYSFKVSYPINHYNITFNAGSFQTWTDTMQLPESRKVLKMSFFALAEDLAKAKAQWLQSKMVIRTLSQLFGDYPFIKDGYKLVQTPYRGMEHQSCIAYGDNFKNNAFGFDFILMHETGHEWWGNRTSANDHAELWIHESFCTYSEALFLERTQNMEQAIKYLLSQKKKIKNKSIIEGERDVYFNDWLDSDKYYKGSWMLHGLRQVVDNDEFWFSWLKSFGAKFGLKPISTQDIIEYASSYFKKNLAPFFKQYLFRTEIPLLVVKLKKEGEKTLLQYKWDCKEVDFEYPAEILINNKRTKIYPGAEWTNLEIQDSKVLINQFEEGLLYDLKVLK